MHSHRLVLSDVHGIDVEEAKQILRAEVRQHRSRRSERERDLLARSWARTAMRFVGKADIVAAYVSVNDEPPTSYLLDSLLKAGKRVLLPKLGPTLKREWAWYRGAEDLEVLAPGRPPEPSGRSLPTEVLADVEVLVIPALLVDPHGCRLGQGGGWYDRILKRTRPRTKVGAMVYPEEFVTRPLPQEDMDRSVSWVILPDAVHRCDGRHSAV